MNDVATASAAEHRVLLGAFFLTLLFLTAIPCATRAQKAERYAPGEVIIKFDRSTKPTDMPAMRAAVNARVKKRFERIGAELWELDGITVTEAIARFKNDRHVVYVEPNYVVHADDVFPNDPRFSQLWGLHNTGQTGGKVDADIDAPEAWTSGTGGTVLVGIIDTGVDWHHVDLAANIFTNPGEIPANNIDDDGNGFVDDVRGWDFVNNDNDPSDDNRHGTHVAGTIAAIGNNGIGVVGVSWSARILPLKFLDAFGSGFTSDAILAVEYATQMGARLTSNSWGGGGFSQGLSDAIEEAGNQGILFVAAAGNDNSNTDLFPHYPSSYDLDNIISVASTDHNDARSGFSNYGLVSVDLGAPGSDILSTFPNNTYGTISGTSMATPHVSGAVALVWAAAPTMSHLEVKNAILATVDPLQSLAGRVASGGRLNVNNLMATLDDVPPASVQNLAIQSRGSNTVRLMWTATGDDGAVGTAFRYDIRYATARITPANFGAATPAAGTPHPKATGSPESFEVTGLNFNTKYYFAMVVEDERANRSDVSSYVKTTTMGVPRLNYTPGSFAASLLTGGTAIRALTLKNNAAGTLDFAASAPSWVHLIPASGRLSAGKTLRVDVIFDATRLAGGPYNGAITLATNDPTQPSVPLPLSLQVTDAADISAQPALFDFGIHYTGTCDRDTLVITNIGTIALSATNLQMSNPAFATDTTPFALAPNQSRQLVITFCPVSVGVLQGALSIQSNDPDHPAFAVPLRGQGVDPPIIAVTPPSFSADLLTGGVSNQVLSISNQGGSDLTFDIGIEDLGGPTLLAAARLAEGQSRYERSRNITPKSDRPARAPATSSYSANHPGSRTDVIKTTRPVDQSAGNLKILLLKAASVTEIRDLLLSYPDISVVDEFDGSSETPTLETLALYDAVILINDFAFGEAVAVGDVLADYVDGGGGVIMTLASFISGWDVRGRFATGGYYPFTLGFGPVGSAQMSTFAQGHRIMAGVESAYGDFLGGTTLAEGAEWVADWDNDYPFIATQGDHVVGVNAFLADGGYWSGDIPLILRNAVIWAAGAAWLTVEPKQGVVPANGTAHVTVSMNAATLDGGNYAANLQIAHNDLIHPTLVVPTQLHVTGAPDISVSETLLDYGTQFIGAAVKDTLVVTNDGTDVLNVGSISSSSPNYTMNPSSFNLPPFTSQDVIVTFAPTTTGPIPAVLTINSNDFDEGVLTVDLRGAGVMPPIVSVSPASLSADLLTGGTADRVVTISNTGASDLDFEISVEPADEAAARVDVFGSATTSANVVATGHPLSRAQLEQLKTSFPKSVTVPASGEIDRGASSTRRTGAGMTLDRVRRTNLEEVFGSDQNEFQAGPRTRGNLFTCTKSTRLREHRFYVDPSSATQMWFLVYEGLTQAGIYTLISASDVSPAGPGLGWYSSGPIDVDMLEGRFYLIVASYERITSYFNEVDISPYPIPASFGELTAGAGWDWAPTENFPPDPIQDVPDWAFGSPVAYYQTIVTSGFVHWLSVAPEAGTVPPATSLDVAVHFDATGQYGGDYDANIQVVSNDPVTPVATVAAHLHVTGAPDIAVSASLLDYGPQFIGAQIKKTLVVTNEGTDLLTVNSISSNHPWYTVDVSNFTLAPEATRNVVVTFAPTTTASAPAVLTIVSDDFDEGTVTVDLRGSGVEPPVISATPASFSEDLITGETATHTLTIGNSGNSPLEFTIKRENVAAPGTTLAGAFTSNGARRERGGNAHATAGRGTRAGAQQTRAAHPHQAITPVSALDAEIAILVIQNHTAWGFDLPAFIQSNFGISPTVINSYQLAAIDLSQFELVITTGDQENDYYTAISSNVAKFESFVAAGGVLQYQLATQGDDVSLVGGAQVIFGNLEAFNNVVTPDHPIVQGLPPVLEGNWANHTYLTGLPAGHIVITETADSREPTTVEYKFGGGTVIATGMTWEWLYLYGWPAGEMLPNAVAYSLSLASVPWLSTEPASGIVQPGQSLNVAVGFDATGLFGGNYLASLRILNNDPLNSEVVLPVDMHVTGAPDISVTPTSLEYGSLYIGQNASKTVVVSNPGTDLLAVSNVSSNLPDFTVDVPNFNLAPNASRTLTVTFAPASAGDMPATLSITSNDPDEGLAQVALHGIGLEAPVIVVSPDSLAATLLSGQKTSQLITIDNSAGGSDLIWAIYIQPVGIGDVGWIDVLPDSGFAPAHTKTYVGANFDATGRPSGDYYARLVVSSNDPVKPEVVIPAHLHVTGVPDIAVMPTQLQFGPVFIGQKTSKTLVVSNTGTDLLNVSNVTSNHADYTTNVTSLSVPVASSRNIVVSFAPTAPGASSGQITITSNDPDESPWVVQVSGNGLVPPVIGVTPDALADTLSAGTTSTHPLLVSNTGGSNLELSVAILKVTAGPGALTGGLDSSGKKGVLAGPPHAVPHIDIEKGEEDTRTYPPMALAQGGPDTFGYLWRDSNEPGGPAFNWIDASEGTSIALTDDQFVTGIPLGFTFNFYGQDFTTIGVSSNGFVSFRPSDNRYPTDVPFVDDYSAIIAPYARDLFAPGANYIKYQTFGTSPNRKFVLEYNNVPDYRGGNYKTFEVILNEGANSIRFQYLVASNAPIGFGIESPDQTTGMGNAGVGATYMSPLLVTSNYAIEFGLLPEWLYVTPSAATIPAGESLNLTAHLDATDLANGDYAAIISIGSNDPLTPTVPVRVDLHVEGGTALIAGIEAVESMTIPRSYALQQNHPNPFNPTTTIAYDLPRSVEVRLVVYDVHGREVTVLASGVQPAGRHEVVWEGRDSRHEPVASGVYFYRLVAAEFVKTTKMVLLK